MEARTEFITEQVIAYLKAHCDYSASLTVDDPVQWLEKPWSVVYFLTLSDGDQKHRVVAKISRFPEQKTPEESWQEDHLIDRGVREYNSLVRIYDYFQGQGNEMLQAVRPIAFVRPINAIVMDFVDASSFYKKCLSPRKLISPKTREQASVLAVRSGEWLRSFHELSNVIPDGPCEEWRNFSPARSRQLLFEAVQHLQQRGIDPTRWRTWSQLENTLEKIDSGQRVWIHSDYHMGNAMVMPQNQIVSMDTGLDKRDHPYTDVGKFLADIQTRWLHTMSYEIVPTRGLVEHLREQFLAGYLQGDPLDHELLALYEGQYLFEKWYESLDSLDTRLAKKVSPVVSRGLGRFVLNPTFTHIIQRWMQRDLQIA